MEHGLSNVFHISERQAILKWNFSRGIKRSERFELNDQTQKSNHCPRVILSHSLLSLIRATI